MIRRSSILALSLGSLAFLLLPQPAAMGAIYITPTAASYSGGFYNPVSNLINGSGLSGGAPYTGVTHTDGGDGSSFKGPVGDILTNPVNLTLGGSYDLTDIYIWNYTNGAGYGGRDARTISISLSTNGVTYSPYGPISLTSVSGGSEARQVFPLLGTATHVRLQMTANWGDGEAGIGEVRFAAAEAPPVPEPSTFILAGLGLLGLGCVALRKKHRRA